MAKFRCGYLTQALLLFVLLASGVHAADPNVVLVPSVDGVKLMCSTPVPDGTTVNWKGPDGNQLNSANGTFTDSRLSYVNGTDLQIANATPADNGNYTCSVEGTEATVVLMVYVTTRPKLMMSFSEETFDSTFGIYTLQGAENATKSITCMIKGAYPKPTVSLAIMNYNNSLLSTIPNANVTTTSSQNATDNTWSVNATTSVTLDYASNNKRFDCNALFTIDGVQTTSTWYARFYLTEVRPTLFALSGQRTLYPNDADLTLTCDTRSRPGIEAVTFYIGGQVLAAPYDFTQSPIMCTAITEPYTMPSYLSACKSNVTIRGLTKASNGLDVGCTFTYMGQTLDSLFQNNLPIDFRFPPTMVNITGNTPVQLDGALTKTLTLNCASDSSNGIVTITWYKDGVAIDSMEPVVNATGAYSGLTFSQNLILNVDRSMAGAVIKCQASNFANDNPVMASVTLNVTYSPIIAQPTAQTYRVYTNERIAISCYAEAKPMATTKWLRVYSATNETEATSVQKIANGNTRLIIENAAMAHAGTYECQATNSISPDGSKRISLIVLDKSQQAPFKVNRMTPTATSVMFEFTLPSDRTLQSLSLRYYSMAGLGPQTYVGEVELALPTSGNQVSATVSGLTPDMDYLFELRETDASYGLVSHTILRQVRTPRAPEDEYTKDDVTEAILISVFVTAAVVAIICVAIFCIIKRGVCDSSSSRGFDVQMKQRA